MLYGDDQNAAQSPTCLESKIFTSWFNTFRTVRFVISKDTRNDRFSKEAVRLKGLWSTTVHYYLCCWETVAKVLHGSYIEYFTSLCNY